MKTLARTGAVLSFMFFFLAGAVTLAAVPNTGRSGEYVLLWAIGLIFMGAAFFAGPLLWLVAEKWCSKANDE